MADSYPERRFISVLNRMEGILYISDDRAGTRDLAEHHAVQSEYANAVVELVPAADMDVLRALVAAARPFAEGRVAGQHPILDALCDAFDAIPPAFLATVEKP